MIELRPAHERGQAELAWLKTSYSFSFADYYDPNRMGFSDLRVINEDYIAPGRGFGVHPHRDMEILTYVLSGQLAHRDSLGNGSVIEVGDVQMMSAGTGIQHSEFNASQTEEVHLLQIWIQPNVSGVKPRYQQRRFTAEEKQGRLCRLVCPDGTSDAGSSLLMHQDAYVYAGTFDGAEEAHFDLRSGRAAYVHVAQGSVLLGDVILQAGDAVTVTDLPELHLHSGHKAEVLLFDLAG